MIAAHVPTSTYRLQFNKDFRFVDAIRLLDYFSLLGITDIYSSPILVSRKGSGHGYDVTDATRIDPEIGTEEEFEELQRELLKRGMGLLLDIVPNHMAASSENRWWMDVLANGPESAFASHFDIDWHPPSRSLDEKVLLPILGRPFGEAIDSGELQIQFDDANFYLQYFDQRFPLSPKSYGQILNFRIDDLKQPLGEHSPAYQEYLGILAGFAGLAQMDRAAMPTDRRLRFDSLIERLRNLVRDHPKVAHFIRSSVDRFNGNPQDPASFSMLERLLNEQHFLLADWQDPNEAINYRRFFAISELVGIRVEDPVVFEATHNELLRVISKSASNGFRIGLRVDHIDGLRDPGGYLSRLQQRVSKLFPAGSENFYIIVEKILAPGETVSEEWPVAGTTGYEYLNAANDLFICKSGAQSVAQIYNDYVGGHPSFADIVYNKKKLVMNSLLRVEMRSLGRRLAELAAKDRYARTELRSELLAALVEATACMPVYRTYIHSLDIRKVDLEYIRRALEEARRRAPQVGSRAFDFLQEVLTLSDAAHILPEQREARLAFVMRWQQSSGPIMAKGYEDTALYVHYPLSSMNEVGGDPEPAHLRSREKFVEFISNRQAGWPHTLNATSTHDTKRTEGVRARINVLSELPGEWAAQLDTWTKGNARHKEMIDGTIVPDANEEYLIYQTLLGLWPFDPTELPSITKRLQEYVVKALREAKIHTRWTRPNEEHEQAVARFIELILTGGAAGGFLPSILEFQKKLAWCGMFNGLGQSLLKITSPGVPDFYQGSELWDFRLVDPDNRFSIDFTHRSTLLNGIAQDFGIDSDCSPELFHNWPDGRIKLFLLWKALNYRKDHPQLFAEGDFVPVTANGQRSQHVFAYLRRSKETEVLTVIPRWLAEAYTPSGALPGADFWGDTKLSVPGGTPWVSIFTGRTVSRREDRKRGMAVGDVLTDFPVGMLVHE